MAVGAKWAPGLRSGHHNGPVPLAPPSSAAHAPVPRASQLGVNLGATTFPFTAVLSLGSDNKVRGLDDPQPGAPPSMRAAYPCALHARSRHACTQETRGHCMHAAGTRAHRRHVCTAVRAQWCRRSSTCAVDAVLTKGGPALCGSLVCLSHQSCGCGRKRGRACACMRAWSRSWIW